MAQSLRKQVEAARVKLDKAQSAIFAAGPDRNTLFSDCRKLAAPEVVAAYEAAYDRLATLEHEACSKGKAWRASGGYLFWK